MVVFEDAEAEAEAAVDPLEIFAAAVDTAEAMFFEDFAAEAEETLFVDPAAARIEGRLDAEDAKTAESASVLLADVPDTATTDEVAESGADVADVADAVAPTDQTIVSAAAEVAVESKPDRMD